MDNFFTEVRSCSGSDPDVWLRLLLLLGRTDVTARAERLRTEVLLKFCSGSAEVLLKLC